MEESAASASSCQQSPPAQQGGSSRAGDSAPYKQQMEQDKNTAFIVPSTVEALSKKPIPVSTLAAGALMQVFEVTTLGQPFEVLKTHMAANRGDSLAIAAQKTWARGGVLGFYQGLIPWAWIEGATKGGVLFVAQAEVDYRMRVLGFSPFASSTIGGMVGGVVQAYTTMGFCTFMKTVEVTRHKAVGSAAQQTSVQIAAEIFRKEGIVGLNKGVSAVAVRQLTNWGSRFGIAKAVEGVIKGDDPTKKLSAAERIFASGLGGALSCWNQPIEVIRVEMQSANKSADRAAKLNIITAGQYIYSKSGFLGFYRGVVPRIGLGVWQTICMVAGGDELKKKFAIWFSK